MIHISNFLKQQILVKVMRIKRLKKPLGQRFLNSIKMTVFYKKIELHKIKQQRHTWNVYWSTTSHRSWQTVKKIKQDLLSRQSCNLLLWNEGGGSGFPCFSSQSVLHQFSFPCHTRYTVEFWMTADRIGADLSTIWFRSSLISPCHHQRTKG